MYYSVDYALKDAYKILCLRIEPTNNTAAVMAWCKTRGGVRRGGTSLTPHEWHANAVMVQKAAERVLNRYELAVVELQYSEGLMRSGIVDLTAFIEQQNNGVNLLICDAVLAHIFIGAPTQTAIMDRFDLSKGALYRQKKKIMCVINALLNSAMCKLELEFVEKGIVWENPY